MSAPFSPSLQDFQTTFGRRTDPQFVPLMFAPVATGFVRQWPAPEPEAAPALPASPPEAAEPEDTAALEAAAAEARAQELATAVAAARQEQVEVFQKTASDLLTALGEAGEARLQALERAAAEVVVEIARRVLLERFADDEQAIMPVVREALLALSEAEHLKVVVAPQHTAVLQECQEELLAALPPNRRLEIIGNNDAAPFGCLVHSDAGSVDARLETRLQALREACEDVVTTAQAA